MILPVFQQGSLFLGTIIAGLILAFFYDIFRVARRIVPHAQMMIHLEDLFYWICVVAVMFYFILMANDGDVRLFSIIGTFIGMIAYAFLISPIFMKFSMKIYAILKKITILLLTILLTPFKMVLRILSAPANLIKRKLAGVYAAEKKMYRNLKRKGRQKIGKAKNNLKIFLKKI